MGNTKVYFVTHKYSYLVKDLEELCIQEVAKRHPELSEDEAAVIVPPVDVFEQNDLFADLGDYDDKDVPMLDKMVELGYLTVSE